MPNVEMSGVGQKDGADFVEIARLIAKKTCIALGTTPEQAARDLLDALNKHGGHTGGLYPMTLGELLMSPELLIGRATEGGWLERLTTERLAAVLWVGARQQRSRVDPVDSFNMGWTLSKIATAIEFPETRARIFSERARATRDKRKDRFLQQEVVLLAKRIWTDDETERVGGVAKYLHDIVDWKAYGLAAKPKVETYVRWIKKFAPVEARRPGAPRKLVK